MPAAYDKYDYKSYWQGRDYEHESEIEALKNLLFKIPKIEKILEIGAGYGRLAPTYFYRAKNIILSDPSSSLLKNARKTLTHKKISFLQSTIDNIPLKIKPNSIDLVVMVRVLHHIQDSDSAFKNVNKVLKRNGYFILEFANKGHGKSIINEFMKGNFTFPIDIFPIDIRSKKSIRNKTIPFLNFHPDIIIDKLHRNGFSVMEKLSVSNIRSQSIKKHIQTNLLIKLESLLQKPLALINFGPSIFILAKKIE